MASAELAHYYATPQEYLAAERIGQRKHEYLAGIIYDMAGASADHERISMNITRELGSQLRSRKCEAFSSEPKVRIRTDAAEFYYYPDAMVDCSQVPGTAVFVEEPRVIFEVMSPDTERIDRGEKMRNYQSIPSLDLYVLVDQFHIAVTAYRRTMDGWAVEFYSEKQDVLQLPTIECSLPMTAIYQRTHLVR